MSTKQRMTTAAAALVLFLGTAPAGHAGVMTPSPLGQARQQQGDEARRAYEAGRRLLLQGDREGARQAFQRALDARPDFAQAMLGMADVAFLEGDRAKARTWVGNALRTHPDDPQVLLAHARLLMLERKAREAEQALRKALEADPGFTAAHVHLGDLYLQQMQDAARAEQEYRKALEQQPDHPGVHFALGLALDRQGKPGAEALWQRAIQLQPDNPLPYLALARANAEKAPAKALEYLDRALALRQGDPALWLMKAGLQLETGDRSGAEKSLEKAVEMDPGLGGAWQQLGMIRQAEGRSDAAREAYLAAIRVDENAWAAYNNLAWMEVERGGDLDQALRWASRARLLQPDSFAVYDTLGWVYRARKQYPRAIAALERAAELQPKSADVWYHLGVVYSEAGKAEQARRALEKAARLAPDSEAGRKAAALLEKGS